MRTSVNMKGRCACRCASASGVIHSVRLPRLRRPASYSGRFVMRCAIFGM